MRGQSGFTLMELLVVIAIAGILTGIAFPSFRSTVQNAETREAASDFYTALARARSEAIARNAPVAICARDLASSTPACQTGTSNWRDGWIVYAVATPTTPLQIHGPLPGTLTLAGVNAPLVFIANGSVGAAAIYTLCRSTPDARGRQLNVSRSGRVSLELKPCT